MAMIIGLVEAATTGDARAGRLVVDLIGEDAKTQEEGRENNLLEAIKESGEVNVDDIPEAE